jgi:hypothetical protein
VWRGPEVQGGTGSLQLSPHNAQGYTLIQQHIVAFHIPGRTGLKKQAPPMLKKAPKTLFLSLIFHLFFVKDFKLCQYWTKQGGLFIISKQLLNELKKQETKKRKTK